MRIAMGLRAFFRRNKPGKKASPPSRAASADSTAPKNGRLTVAVVVVLVLMLALALLNVRLILDPSIAGKAFGPLVPSRPDAATDQAQGPSCATSEAATNPAPPQVTFYSKLVAQDDQTHCSALPNGDHAANRDAHADVSKTVAPQAAASPDKHPEKKAIAHASPGAKDQVRTLPTETSLPRPDSGTGTYMVQVGAFTNPGIAQQWAARWKSRGYEVMLKPIARPKTGILYRLYLGKFASQHEADALVERLKVREGITAFRLLVRN